VRRAYACVFVNMYACICTYEHAFMSMLANIYVFTFVYVNM